MFKAFFSGAKKVVNAVSSRAKTFAVAAMLTVGAFASQAEGTVTLPTLGFSVTDYITAGITVMGGVAAAAIGGYAAFLVVRKALRWVGKALG